MIGNEEAASGKSVMGPREVGDHMTVWTTRGDGRTSDAVGAESQLAMR
jgi:hypothetical protein